MAIASYRTAPPEGPSCQMHPLARATETCGNCAAAVCDVCATLTAYGVACQACERRIRVRRALKAGWLVVAMVAAVLGTVMSLPEPPKRPEALIPPDLWNCQMPNDLPRVPCAPPISDHAPETAFDAMDASVGVLDTGASLQGDRWPGDLHRRWAADAGGDGRAP